MTWSFLENASAQKVLFTALGLMLATWLGGKVNGADIGNTELAGVAAIVVLYVVVDHLHAIRKALARDR